MVTAISVEDKARRSRTVHKEDPDLLLLIHLLKMISTMIISPPNAKPNPSSENTEIKK